MNRLLIIEDEVVIRGALRRLLERHGHQVDEAGSVEEAQNAGRLASYQLIIADLRLPGQPGDSVLELAPSVPVIIMTSYASVSSAVEAMKNGAADYIAKPFDHDELVLLVERILREKQKERRAAALQTDVDLAFPVAGLVGRSAAMSEVCSRIHKVAPTEATVLITGESGSGKELVARALHRHSRRADAPFVAFNCAALPEQSIEAELFGQDQAERFRPGLIQQAEGGTLFLDEIGELPLPAQARLLRVLQGATHGGEAQDAAPDVRILAATHRDLRRLVQQNLFRSDLYFRLRVVELALPPLRERGDDLIELAVFLLDRTRRQLGRPPMTLSREAFDAIRRYNWPGNVRELANAIERAVILCDGDRITPDLLAIDHRVTSANPAEAGEHLSLEEYFRVFVLEHQDHMTETELANALGISRKTLWERRQRFGLPRPKRRG
jgi:DNA-binding NtrC family response regulator